MDRKSGQLNHPLDRPIWSALTTRQAGISERADGAVRLRRDIGVFAAAADASAESRSALTMLDYSDDGLWLLERDAVVPPPGLIVHHRAPCVQMVAHRLDMRASDIAFDNLTDADATQMFALARLCEPGPFFEHTNRMGRFIGVRHEGRLIAMAGERLQPEGYTEVSGVCTHPHHRGRGYAAALMRIVAARILARDEVPFLHSYASNAGAIALYEALGFRNRASIMLTVLTRATG